MGNHRTNTTVAQATTQNPSSVPPNDGLIEFADGFLDLAVELAISVNESAIANAQVLGELRDTDARAGAIAAATAQLSASVGSVARGLEGAEKDAMAARSAAHAGRRTVAEALETMTNITEAVGQTGNRCEIWGGRVGRSAKS